MVRFLDSVADILRAKLVYLGTSHTQLFLSRIATYPEFMDEPSVGVHADNMYVNVWYTESWQDGELFRTAAMASVVLLYTREPHCLNS